MAKFRVKAYYMHEHEEAAARKAEAADLIRDAEWTPGYVIGVVDEASIPGLQQQGLVVTPVERVVAPRRSRAPDADPDRIATRAGDVSTRLASARFEPLPARAARALPMALSNVASEQKVLSRHSEGEGEGEQFYVVRFHGPLTEERLSVLRQLDAMPIERVSRNKYTVPLREEQVDALAQQAFVNWIRLYDDVDTMRALPPQASPGGPVPRGAPGPAAVLPPPEERRTGIYAVRLHLAKDMEAVIRWLAARHRKPLWKGGDLLRVGLPADGEEIRELARLPAVALIEEVRPARLLDDVARRLLGLPEFPAEGAPPALHLTGEGELIAIADTGIDDQHPDFAGRLQGIVALGRPGDHSDPEGHGTHVAGCAAGDGSASGGVVAGAAPGARIFFQSILDANGGLGGLPMDLGKLFQQAYDAGARIHNNSWGAFAFARYSATSLDVDRFVASHPDMLVVIAAGNDGISAPRMPGTKMLANKGFVDWGSVTAPATAKNALTVGASRSARTSGGMSRLTWGATWGSRYPHPPISKETISGNDQCLAAFSSRGPCDDQRIKPDVVAPGTDIAAARSKLAPLHKFWGAFPGNSAYGFMGGTSMAAPYVAGCAALVREWYRKHAGYASPSAALVKATLVNGACRITGGDAQAPLLGDPNFHQGFGRIHMPNTLPNGRPGMRLEFEDSVRTAGRAFITTGSRIRFSLDVGAGLPLRICLVWTDPPARSLQNGLVLLVDDTGTNKWIGNHSAAVAGVKPSGLTTDPNNNVQAVRLAEPAAGRYTIAVTAANLIFPPQEFALVVTGELLSSLAMLP